MNSLELPLAGRHTAVALGCFDGIHIGHRAVISAAVSQKERGLAPCVFTFTVHHPSGATRKGQLMLQSLPRKLRELETMGVEYVSVPDFEDFCRLTPEEFVRDILVKRFSARVVCCGFNFRFGRGAAGDAALLRTLGERYGIQTVVCPAAEVAGIPVSSTAIRERILQGDMSMAMRLLGHPFTIDFEVIRGNELGRKMQFPTINQAFPAQFAVPRYGVYASIVQVQGGWYPGVTNVGVKPTVSRNSPPLAETYIEGVHRDLYGQNIEVALLEFLRPEQKFSGLEELRAQIAADTRRAVSLAGAYLAQQGLPVGVPDSR